MLCSDIRLEYCLKAGAATAHNACCSLAVSSTLANRFKDCLLIAVLSTSWLHHTLDIQRYMRDSAQEGGTTSGYAHVKYCVNLNYTGK